MKTGIAGPGAVGLGAALCYLGTLTSRFAYDGVAYCSHVLVALTGGGLSELFQANHLLFSPLAAAMGWLTGGAGAELALHVRLQVLQALLGGATLGLLYAVLRRHAPWPVAFGVVASVGTTYAYWHFATDVEVYTLAALLVAVALAAALRAVAAPDPGRLALAGAAAGLAALGHMAHGMFGIATVLVLVAWAPRGRRVAAVAAFCAGAGAVLTVGFLPLLAGPWAVVPFGEARSFLLGYARPESVGQYLAPPWQRLPQHLETAARAVAAESPVWFPPVLAVGLVGLAVVGLAVAARRDTKARAPVVLAVAWLVAHAVFFLSWDHNEKYWIAAMIPAALLAAAVLGAVLRRAAASVQALPALLVAAVLVAVNGPVIRREMAPEHNRFLVLAREVRSATGPEDTLLVSGMAPWLELKVYLPYFAERRTVVLDFALASGRTAELERLMAAAGTGAVSGVYALDELVERPLVRQALSARYGMPAGEVDRLLAAACPLPDRVLGEGSRLYRIGPCPSSDGFEE